ncbi:MAG: hypothetical protein ABIF09_03055 [Gemmatimonadota bacterium]
MPGEPKTPMPDELTFRPFSSMEEYEACTKLQEEVWGEGFSEKVSAAILMIANRLGGLAAGAFDEGGSLQGFVFGLTGVVDGRLVHWSDMLAVRREGRDLGLGTRLKLYQRTVLLERGVREMRWTFDPLQGRNAHVNFSKLGIVCREYVESMYGETDSPLHRGVGTDRLVAIWDMASERVEARLKGGGGGPSMEDLSRLPPLSQLPQLLPTIARGPFPSPGAPILGLDDPLLLLAVPGVVDAIMEGDLPLAIRWREATRELFLHYFSRGYEAREFLRGDGLSYYLLVGPGEGGEVGPGGISP